MDRDRELRSDFRHALDEVTPSAPWLAAIVRERLGADIPTVRARSPRRRAMVVRWPQTGRRLAAAVLVVILAATAVGVFLVARRAMSQPVPGGLGPARGTISFGIFSRGDEHVFTMHADGSGEKQLVSTTSCCMAWSHKGDRLMLASAKSTASHGPIATAIVNVDGTGYRLFRLDTPGLNLGPGAWSPDDSRIAFDGWDDAQPSRNGIYTADATDAGNRLRITSTTQHDVPLSYSPDGSRILFRRGPADSSQQGQLFVVGVGGGPVTRVNLPGTTVWLGFGAPGGWSPDGNLIAFAAYSPTSADDSRGAVFLAAGDGSNATRISDCGHNVTAARWSPKGDWILFDSGVSATNGTHHLFLIRPDGSETKMIPAGGCCALWSPDGDRVLFITGPDHKLVLWTVGIDGTHRAMVATAADVTDVGWTNATG